MQLNQVLEALRKKSPFSKRILSTLGFKDKDKEGKPISPDSREIYKSIDY